MKIKKKDLQTCEEQVLEKAIFIFTMTTWLNLVKVHLKLFGETGQEKPIGETQHPAQLIQVKKKRK